MRALRGHFGLRLLPFNLCLLAVVALGWLVTWHAVPWVYAALATAIFLSLLGIRDRLQRPHAILRNYPIIGHIRYLVEAVRPELRQYLFESDTDGVPFNREQRSVVYQRAKMALDKRPFGTELDVYGGNFEWLEHSMSPSNHAPEGFRIDIGGSQCTKPYSASVFNISAMSFGALSANAIRALNKGAKLGGFAHDTGEGGLSPYHREHGGDIIWEIGSGYFGCRKDDGTFDPQKFAALAADPQVKMVELKLSQGAKPGHGGVLPAAKVSREIARTRGVPIGADCISPARHSAFATPVEMLHFIAKMRELSGGKPAGFKLCVGQPWEFLAVVKAMVETGITPDFIVIDGKEGGTGAAPSEFTDHIGKPLREGLNFVHNALIGAGLRQQVKLGASGKIVTAFDMVRAFALGADWCNSARGFMFAIGCIQSQSCHTDRCPTGVATQDVGRQRALVVPDKAQRVANFHRATIATLGEVLASAGLNHPRDVRPVHISRRTTGSEVATYADLYPTLAHGELLTGSHDRRFRDGWAMADAKTFSAVI